MLIFLVESALVACVVAVFFFYVFQAPAPKQRTAKVEQPTRVPQPKGEEVKETKVATPVVPVAQVDTPVVSPEKPNEESAPKHTLTELSSESRALTPVAPAATATPATTSIPEGEQEQHDQEKQQPAEQKQQEEPTTEQNSTTGEGNEAIAVSTYTSKHTHTHTTTTHVHTHVSWFAQGGQAAEVETKQEEKGQEKEQAKPQEQQQQEEQEQEEAEIEECPVYVAQYPFVARTERELDLKVCRCNLLQS